jgi:hypothetical protein
MMKLNFTNRAALNTLIVLAPIAWASLLLFVNLVPPRSIIVFVVFFILLDVALTSTFSPIAYAISLRFLASRLYRATARHAIRQGALLALCIVLNLLLRALHSWNILTAFLIFAAAIIIEVISLARK